MESEDRHEHGNGSGSPFAAFASLFGEGSPLVPGNGPECAVCPVCLLLYGIRQARPEVMEHLTKASLELVLAMKAVVDSAAEKQDRGGGLHRIPIS
jgi:hypothetical protein